MTQKDHKVNEYERTWSIISVVCEGWGEWVWLLVEWLHDSPLSWWINGFLSQVIVNKITFFLRNGDCESVASCDSDQI